MMLQPLIAPVWGGLVLLSMLGWGQGVNRALFPEHRADAAQQATWGLAFSVCIGSLLNLAHVISPEVLVSYVLIGIVVFLLETWPQRQTLRHTLAEFWFRPQNRLYRFGLLALGAVLVVYYLNWSYTYFFNRHDDYHAYFVFIEKQLQIGTLGNDPFNARRLESALGGQSFLQALTIGPLSLTNLNLLDPGLCFIILTGVIVFTCQDLKSNRWLSFPFIALLLFLPYPKLNSTATLTITLMAVGLFRTLSWPGLNPRRFLPNATIVALLTAALLSLKSTSIPPTALFLMISYGLYLLTGKGYRRHILLEIVACTLLIGAFLLPWMISLHQSSGTLLYPILGKGFHGSTYSAVDYHHEDSSLSGLLSLMMLVLAQPYFIVLIVLTIVSLTLPDRWQHRGASLAFLVSAILGSLAIAITVGEGPGISRYSLPFTIGAILMPLMGIVATYGERIQTRRLGLFGIMSLGASTIALGNLLLQNQSYFLNKSLPLGLTDLRRGLGGGQFRTLSDRARYRDIQSTIPEGAKLMARLDYPYLLDFRRNPTFVPDWPGGASLPPGMPMYQGFRPLAEYLLSHNIRYVMYSYQDEANFDRASYGKRLEPDVRPWQRVTAKQTFDFQDNLVAMSQHYRKLYDDGRIFVLDLGESTKP